MKKILTITALLFIIGCFQSCGTLQKINKQANENALKLIHQPKPVIVFSKDTVWMARPPLTQDQIKAIFTVQLEKINKNQEIQANNDVSRTEDLHKLAGVVDKLVEDSRTRTENSKSVLDNQSIFARMYASTMKDNGAYRKTIKDLQSQITESAKMTAAKSDSTTKSVNRLGTIFAIIALILATPQIVLWYRQKSFEKSFLLTHSQKANNDK